MLCGTLQISLQEIAVIKKLLIILYVCVAPLPLFAATELTTGGVTWLDTLGYVKPAFYPLTVPVETAANKYYVDLASGSDSANCTTTGTPCKTMNGLAGKAYSPLRGGGTDGAYVYLKGNGYFNITSSFYGASGKEIVIKPWPGDTTTYYFTSAGSGESNNMHVGAAGDNNTVKYVIVDGGPNLQFIFRPFSGTCNINTDGATSINGANNTIYRVQFTGNTNNTCESMAMASSWGALTFDGLRIINCEFHDNIQGSQGSDLNQLYGIYAGGGSSCAATAARITNMYILNNIFRDLGSLGVQIEPRGGFDNVQINGNAIHDVGQLSCGGTWGCRPAIAYSQACYGGGGVTNGYAINNLMWTTASSCIWVLSAEAGAYKFYNNTCWDFGNTKGQTQDRSDDAYHIDYDNRPSGTITARNNIGIHASRSFADNQSPITMSNNSCYTSDTCGTSSQRDTIANMFLSIDTADANFLRIKSTSKAVNTGYATGVTSYYFGSGTRSGTLDIGADEYGVSEAAPAVPTIIGVTLSGGNLQ
jgi:hypothetical protein